MPSLYKYIPEKYVEGFIRRGEILFRSLSYFRDYEDSQIRGDEFEGTRVFRPKSGLPLHNVTQNIDLILPHSFESSANEDDIFVFCFSNVLSPVLFEKFKCDYCIEITKPRRLSIKLKGAILPMPAVHDKLWIFDSVKYYTPEEPPMVDWALPERIALSKPFEFGWQQECRAAFAVNNAFRPENVQVRIVPPGERKKPKAFSHPEMLIQLGNLSSLCKVWKAGECA